MLSTQLNITLGLVSLGFAIAILFVEPNWVVRMQVSVLLLGFAAWTILDGLTSYSREKPAERHSDAGDTSGAISSQSYAASIRRWNFDADDDGLLVCSGNHDKASPCEMERLSPHEALEIINALRAESLEYSALLQRESERRLQTSKVDAKEE